MKMKKSVIVSVFAAASLAFPAYSEVYSLVSGKSMMLFETAEAAGAPRLFLRQFGARVEDAQSALRLAWNGESSSSLGMEAPLAYSVLGDSAGNLNRFGGLAVEFADGCRTLDLAVTGVENRSTGGNQELVVSYADRHYPLQVVQTFRLRKGSEVFETSVTIRNTGRDAVRLRTMDSLAVFLPLVGDRFRFQSAAAQWASEGQLGTSEIVRGQTVSIGSRSGVRDAWMNNPSFMLEIGAPATETDGEVIGVALAWTGAWHAGVRRSQTDSIEICAGVDNFAGDYVLDGGRSIDLPTVLFSHSTEGRGEISRAFHRFARLHWLPAGTKERPTLLNNWEGTYMAFTEPLLNEIMDGAVKAGVEMFVLDDGWFGRGEFARDDDHRGLGDWCINEKKLPHGLVGVANEAAKRGLRFGFWVEPEMANTRSELVTAHPEWVLREKNRELRQGRGGTQVVLDFTNPDVRDAIWKQLDAAYASVPSLAYVKWDANADFMNLGSPYLDAAHQGNLVYEYTMGYYDVLNRQRTKYPKVDLQACASGGGHMDYGSLRYADEFWTSDDTDARERVMIQWGASQFYPACAMASHVTICWGRKTPMKFRCDVASSGRLGLEMQPKKMTADELALVKNALAEYRRLRPVIQQGDLYRLVSPYERDYASLMYVDEAKRNAVVFVYGLSRRMQQNYVPPLHLQGLDPAKKYRLRELNTWPKSWAHSKLLKRPDAYRAEMADGVAPVSGEALMKLGLPIWLGTDDYDSAVFELFCED